ncbi:MAG: EAL domain-containing protein [Clostridia bacterium]|nr:EAL domain-containing protein [Clostridia bacterium]
MLKRLITLLLALCLTCTAAAQENAAAPEPLRVAVLDYPRYSALDDNGKPVGLAMDYLAALAQYSGWTYEYVPLTLDEAREQLLDGRIDLIPGRSSSFSSEALYGAKSMGSAVCVLVCRSDDDRYAFQDYEAFHGMRVGMLAGSDYAHELERMETAIGYQLETVLYPTHDECMDALTDGSVDALLMLNIRRDETTKDIARFGSTDLYMAVTPTRPDLLEVLNQAQEQMYANDPFCMLTWWEKHYSDTLVSLNLTRAELNYLSNLESLKVGVLNAMPVYAYTDQDGSPAGISIDMLGYISDRTGVVFDIQPVSSVCELTDGLQSGAYDIIVPLQTNADVSVPDSIRTLPLLTANLSMTGLASANIKGITGMSVALESDSPLLMQIAQSSLDACSLNACPSLEEALQAVLDGSVSAALATELSLQKLLERPRYNDLTVYPFYSEEFSISIGLRSDADPLLISALEKTVATLTETEQDDSIIRHTVRTPYQLTFSDVFYAFRQPLSIVLVLGAAIVTLLISIYISTRIHRQRMAASRAALDREMQQRQHLEQQRETDNRHREELRFLATHDTLTKLYNFNGFEIATRRLLDTYPNRMFKIVRVDINRFKIYNDLFGEEAGQRILKGIADRIKQLATPLVTYGRLFNDHFVMCMPVEVDVDALSDEQTLWLREQTNGYDLTPCFGVYDITDRDQSITIMCDRAMAAMLTVKHLYPPRVGHYTQELRQTLLDEQWVTANMRPALLRGEFVPYFQPQYHLYTGQITGAEVLVRWLSEEKGSISPGQFVPIFEKNGFITEMDLYIWEVSCKWLRHWLDGGNPPIALSINASRLDVRDLDLPTLLPELVARYGLPPALIRLEITESAYMQDPDQLIRTMRALQEAGFTIEMDDFGSGYSSLNLLKDVPVDVLKLDMRFLSSGDEFGRSASIIRSVVNMSKWLNLSVIAEGVETVQQSDFLKSVGCTHAQGYRYSKPVDAAAFEALLHAGNISVSDERRTNTVTVQPDRTIMTAARQLILLVDDKEVRRNRLREILGDRYDYIEADSGEMALSLLQTGLAPDCMLLDTDMPGMSGFELLHVLRNKPETGEMLVLMLLPIGSDESVTRRALDCGANDFIYTPFFPELIRHRVHNQLLLQTAMRQAQTDGLTGLLNRTTFRHLVEAALETSEGSPAQGVFMTLDLDSFKNLNDLYGHPFGDKVLTAFADVLTSVCGDRALIGRLGGDEFGVLVPNLSSRAEMRHIAEQILEQAGRIVIDDHGELVSCSLGASIYPADFVRRTDLYAAADQALYAAKQQGSGHMMFYDELLK